MAQQLRTVTATISRVNDRGLQTQERPGEWQNLSKFATPAPIIPPVGSEVELSIDAAGFIREIRLVEAPVSPIGDTSTGATTAPESACPSFSLDRATLYARCLTAAATHWAGVGRSSSGDVEELADVWFRRAVAVGARRVQP